MEISLTLNEVMQHVEIENHVLQGVGDRLFPEPVRTFSFSVTFFKNIAENGYLNTTDFLFFSILQKKPFRFTHLHPQKFMDHDIL